MHVQGEHAHTRCRHTLPSHENEKERTNSGMQCPINSTSELEMPSPSKCLFSYPNVQHTTHVSNFPYPSRILSTSFPIPIPIVFPPTYTHVPMQTHQSLPAHFPLDVTTLNNAPSSYRLGTKDLATMLGDGSRLPLNPMRGTPMHAESFV